MSEFNPWRLQQQAQQSPIPSFLPDVNAILAPKAQPVANWFGGTQSSSVGDVGYNPYAGSSPAFAPVRDGVVTPVNTGWFSEAFGGFDTAMKGINQKFQDWGVTGGKDAKTGNTFNGWGGLALGAAQGIANWMGAKDQFALQKKATEASIANANENMRMNKLALRDNLESRQIARVASNPGAYQSVGEYMKQTGLV